MTLTPARVFGIATIAVFLIVVVGGIVMFVPRWTVTPSDSAPASAAAAATATPVPKIKATLFYVDDDGAHLKPFERDVPVGQGAAEQATRLIEAQLDPPAAPLISAIPAGTQLRSLFVTDRGEAFVDLTRDVNAAHPGGSLNEILTVYTIVQALTTNLPAVIAVQILVDGREVDTLAGHVDLRRPLPANPAWIRRDSDQ